MRRLVASRLARVALAVALSSSAVLHAQLPPPAAPLGPVDLDLARCFQNAQAMPDLALAIADQLIAAPGVLPVVALRAHACAATAGNTRGDPARAERHAAAMTTLLATHDFSPDERVRALMTASSTLGNIGEWQRALDLLKQAGTEARSFHNVYVQLDTLAGIAAIQNTWMNDPPLADATLREAIALAVAAKAESAALYYNFGYNLLSMGRHDAAMEAFDRALVLLGASVPQPAPPEVMRARVQTHRGVILQARGDTRAARALYEESLATQTRISEQQGRAVTLMHLGTLQLDEGDAPQALATVQQALQLAEQGRFAREQLAAVALLARIHAALGHGEEQRAMVERGRAIEAGILRGQNPRGLAGLQAQLAGDVQSAGIARAAQVRTLTFAALGIVLVFALGVGLFHWRLRRRVAAPPTTGHG